MKLVVRKVSELKEHPGNKDYFADITGEFWSIFIDDIRENGIKEPLSLNTVTGYVYKGCQRLRAARELGIEDVFVLEEEIHEPEAELDELIRDNVMRREIDIFTKFRLVNILRDKVKGKKRGPKSKGENEEVSPDNRDNLPPIDRIAQMINESRDTVTMAKLFESLSSKNQDDVREWFRSQEKEPSKKALNQQIRQLKAAEDKIEQLWEQVQGKDGELDEKEKEISKLQAQLKELGTTGKETADLETLREQVSQLRKKRKEMLDEQRGIRILTNVLTRSRDFFSNECLQLPAVAASAKKSSQELMKNEVLSFLILVDDWKGLMMKAFAIGQKELENDG